MVVFVIPLLSLLFYSFYIAFFFCRCVLFFEVATCSRT
nr:MAG TPA: hypothetical protein [Caudoviricetes sp.]